MQRHLIDLQQLPYSSTNDAIIDAWTKSFGEYKLKKQKMVGIVVDGGGNFQLGARKFAQESNSLVLWCNCHFCKAEYF